MTTKPARSGCSHQVFGGNGRHVFARLMDAFFTAIAQSECDRVGEIARVGGVIGGGARG
jgi:hypothetical protein